MNEPRTFPNTGMPDMPFNYYFRKVSQDTVSVGCVKDGEVLHEYPEGESPCDVCGQP